MTQRTYALFTAIALLAACAPEPPRDDANTKGSNFQNIRPTDPRTPEEERKGFILPPGFEIELFASEPDIDKPMNLAFDARGRMWVTSSFEYPFPTTGKTGTDRLTIIEDTDGDGRADKFTDVMNTLNIPIGILPLNDGAISYSVPNVYRFADTNADGQPESTSIMLGPFGYRDTHGMISNFMRGYDGWVYACHGYNNRSTFAGTDGDSITLESGNTFRFRMDGSHVQQLTFGQVNPFGLVFDVFGYVYSTDSHTSPLHQLIRGGDYPHFGKVSVMGFAPDMKSFAEEATSLCGITQYADDQFPEEFRNNFFIGDVVNSRVHRYSASWKGSSPVGTSEVDFIKSEDPWFRPVNIKLGPDGALYVADFYNAIIGHYEVPLNHPKRDKQRGRIWRITYKGNDRERPDLQEADLESLLRAMDHVNLPIRTTATDQITDRIGATAIEALTTELRDPDASPRKLAHTLWALHRLDGLTAEQLHAAVVHSDSLVRLHALRVLAERAPDATYYNDITAALSDRSPHVQRAAVELLPQFAGPETLELALGVAGKTNPDYDNHLFYTARLAMRTILRDPAVLDKIIAKAWSEQDAALLAAVMVDVPLPASAQFLTAHVGNGKLPIERVPAAYRQIARFSPVNELNDIAARAMSGTFDVDVQTLIYRAMVDGLNQRGGNVKLKVFETWPPAIASAVLKKYPASDLTDSEAKVRQQTIAIEIAGDFKLRSLEPALQAFLSQGHVLGWNVRTTAMRSLMKINPANASWGADIITKDSIVEYQRRIAAILGEFPGPQVNKALDKLETIPPGVQEAVVIALASTSEGKDIAFRKVREGKILPRTLRGRRAEELLLSKASMQQQSELAALTADLAPVSEERQALIEARAAAFDVADKSKLSIDSGMLVFQQNCAVCHKTGNEMGVGPQLIGIGKTGARGLLEKILDPNRNISLSFKNYTITLKDGTVKSGLFRRDEGQARIFADITGKEFTVRQGDIAEQKLSKFTLMPDAFGETIGERDLISLVNYLITL